MSLSNEEIDLYSRQILVPEIGGRGQERLCGSSVAWCGTSPAIRTAVAYLERSGVDRVAELAVAATPDVVLADWRAWAGSRNSSAADRAADRPLVIGHCDATVAWYSRGTIRGHCVECIAAVVAPLATAADSDPPRPNADPVVGAALALHVIRELLGLEIVSSHLAPCVVELRGGGSERRTHRLDDLCGPPCTHGDR